MPQSFIAELVVSHPDLPLMPTLNDRPNVTVELEAQPLITVDADEGPALFFSVEGTEFPAFESALEADHTVVDWEAVTESADRRLYQITLRSTAKFVTPETAALGVHILSVQSVDQGWLFRLQAADKESLGAYWQYCRDEGVQFDLKRIYSTDPWAPLGEGRGLEADLTERQLEVARTAARMGYYRSDGASAEAVAAELGISRSTLSTHLRRIIAKLFERQFGE